ncbi:hypothetical protein ACFDR9_001881 [Janthinobacterium sp. CG_23.3]|uniref:hypothetical protein n=1 Tax=Janthinobacterium sp. CG_23.3 TaxID=3349634 RepID=UPI0038D4E9C3
MRHITHPTKEQVRAYMQQREAARRPPPTADEIRRQLGWIKAPLHASGTQSLFFPAEIAQLAALLAVEWLFRIGGAHTKH